MADVPVAGSSRLRCSIQGLHSQRAEGVDGPGREEPGGEGGLQDSGSL